MSLWKVFTYFGQKLLEYMYSELQGNPGIRVNRSGALYLCIASRETRQSSKRGRVFHFYEWVKSVQVQVQN